MDHDDEISRLREIVKTAESSVSKQANLIFDLEGDLKSMKLRMYNLIEENTLLKNKIEYYRHTVRQIRIPIEAPDWLEDEINLASGQKEK